MKTFDEFLYKFARGICGLLMAAMLVLIFSQVMARYVFQYSLTWSEEIGRYIFVWITFLGAAVAYRSGSHVALDLLCNVLSGVPRKILVLVNDILVVALASAVTYSGYKLFLLGMRQKSPALKIPMQWVYIIIPISGLILLFFALRVIWLRNKKTEETAQ